MAMFGGGPVPGPDWTPEMRAAMEKVLPKDVAALVKSMIPMMASQAFIYLGRVDHPLQGRRVRDLAQAHLAVECMLALMEKVDPMLTEQERADLRRVTADVQMHYVQARNEGQ